VDFEEFDTEIEESTFFDSLLSDFCFVVLDFVHSYFLSVIFDVRFAFLLLVSFELLNVCSEFLEIDFFELLFKFFVFASVFFIVYFQLFVNFNLSDLNVYPTFDNSFC